MLNLLINLKKFRVSDVGLAGNMLLLLSFISGSVLFWLFGMTVYNIGCFRFSELNLCVAVMTTLVLIMFSAFSQLGIIQVAVFDAFFEFLISCFVFSRLTQELDLNSIAILCLQVFAIATVVILCSQKSIRSSAGILRFTVGDKKCGAEFAVNTFVLIALLIILLIICLNAF